MKNFFFSETNHPSNLANPDYLQKYKNKLYLARGTLDDYEVLLKGFFSWIRNDLSDLKIDDFNETNIKNAVYSYSDYPEQKLLNDLKLRKILIRELDEITLFLIERPKQMSFIEDEFVFNTKENSDRFDFLSEKIELTIDKLNAEKETYSKDLLAKWQEIEKTALSF